ncbi:unnamed protein product [Paramecium sonneborni]|uniref:Uncharacterized protein n=1 Tax=Paramecium sonneborni TaxID=65129 RepID=A0A8S1MK84_9CILI|nr:unnamed protein product [Paramecium sonneborni]
MLFITALHLQHFSLVTNFYITSSQYENLELQLIRVSTSYSGKGRIYKKQNNLSKYQIAADDPILIQIYQDFIKAVILCQYSFLKITMHSNDIGNRSMKCIQDFCWQIREDKQIVEMPRQQWLSPKPKLQIK